MQDICVVAYILYLCEMCINTLTLMHVEALLSLMISFATTGKSGTASLERHLSFTTSRGSTNNSTERNTFTVIQIKNI